MSILKKLFEIFHLELSFFFIINTNNDQQQKGTIIIGNAINPREDNNSNTNQTWRKKRTTTLKSLDNNIQNTPVKHDRDKNESDQETNWSLLK